MKSEALLCSNVEELASKIENLKLNSFSPSLAFVFANEVCNISEIDNILTSNNIDFIGCSTAGEIKNTDLSHDSIVVLLLEAKKSHYKILHNNYDESITESANKAGLEAKKSFQNPGLIIFSGGIAVDGQQIVQGIKNSLGKDIPIFGGLGGNNLEFLKSLVYANNFQSDNGYATVIFDTDKIKLNGIASSGWEGLGKYNTITKSSGNVVYEINNEPALTELKKYFGDELFYAPKDAPDVIAFPGQFPLKIYNEIGTDILRAIVYVNLKDESIILAGGVEQGARFKYCPTPDIKVVTDTVDIYKNKLGEPDKIDAVLMISCLIRHHAFGPLFEEEINSIYNLWDKPMAGFLSYGEIGNTGEDDIVEFHNATCSLVSLTEVA